MARLNYLTFHLHFVETVLPQSCWIAEGSKGKKCTICLGVRQNAWWKHSMETHFNISSTNILIAMIIGILISEKIKKISCSLIPTSFMQTFLLWLSTSKDIHDFLTFQLIVTDVFMFSEILYITFTQPDQVLHCSKCDY